VQIFIGEYLLRLPAGQEIVSSYIHLPVARRSYFAMCGVTSRDMRVSLYVEDRDGRVVTCVTQVGETGLISSPAENKGPRLGGGFVIAHLHGKGTGDYRLRVRAETDCLIDHVDLRPAMDVGIGIVAQTKPVAHHDALYNGEHSAFYDYTRSGSTSEPVTGIPQVSGPGTITIKNGVIRSGAVGVLSWGIQSTAEEVKIVLDNVRIIAAGINSNAVDVPQATIRNCRFDIDTPFIINRHVSEHAVVLRGSRSSEVAHCEFYGGQGCLTIKGEHSLVHHNLFVNHQTVTNHYCVMAMGDGSKIYQNRFWPKIGSGVEIFRHKRIEIFDNDFRIAASPPTCEYGHEEYSTTGIRVADYGAAPGSPRGSADNRIYRNRFHIVGRDFPQYPDYIPMAWAFFHSASGGDTHVYENEITVEHQDPESKAIAAALYIGGAANGGFWHDNRIASNVPAIWLATPYGSAENAKISRNTITILAKPGAAASKPVRIGYAERPEAVARNIEFRSNVIEGTEFGVDAANSGHSYSVYWTLTVYLIDDGDEQAVRDEEVRIMDRQGKTVTVLRTDEDGRIRTELLEYSVDNHLEKHLSPYSVAAGSAKLEVNMNQNREIVLRR
jgi:hypothetical protein